MASNSAGIGGLLPPQTTDVANYILTTDGQTASWEASSASLPSQGGNSGKYLTTNGTSASWAAVSALPDQTGNNGKVLGTNGTAASWVDPTALSLGAFSSAPSADGLTLSSGTLNMDPADNTRPGGVSITTQTFKGVKTITDGLKSDVGISGVTTGQTNYALTSVSGYAGLWLGAQADTPSSSNYSILDVGGILRLNASGDLGLWCNNVQFCTVNHTTGNFELPSVGTGIKFTSPDGNTTKILTIDNTGTPVWT